MTTLGDLQANATAASYSVASAEPGWKEAALHESVEGLSPGERTIALAWCTAQAAVLSREADDMNLRRISMGNERIDKFVVAGFGLLFLIAMIVIAIFIPSPTPFQQNVFRIVLALAAAGVGGSLPGVLQTEGEGKALLATLKVRGGSAAAFFLIVYLINPAAV